MKKTTTKQVKAHFDAWVYHDFGEHDESSIKLKKPRYNSKNWIPVTVVFEHSLPVTQGKKTK